MKRKILSIGKSSLAISIPHTWAKENEIKLGEDIYCKVNDTQIIISTVNKNIEKSIEVDITELDRTSIIYLVQSLYRSNYSKIKLKFKKNATKHYRTNKKFTYNQIINYICSRLIGFESISQESTRNEILYMGHTNSEDFDITLRRILIQLNQTSQNLYEGLINQNSELEMEIKAQHDSLAKFINYCFRIINSGDFNSEKKGNYYYQLLTYLDKIVDIYKHVSKINLKEIELNQKEKETFFKCLNTVNTFYSIFYKFDMQKVKELIKTRAEIRNEIKEISQNQKLWLLIELQNVPEFVTSMLESYISINSEKI